MDSRDWPFPPVSTGEARENLSPGASQAEAPKSTPAGGLASTLHNDISNLATFDRPLGYTTDYSPDNLQSSKQNTSRDTLQRSSIRAYDTTYPGPSSSSMTRYPSYSEDPSRPYYSSEDSKQASNDLIRQGSNYSKKQASQNLAKEAAGHLVEEASSDPSKQTGKISGTRGSKRFNATQRAIDELAEKAFGHLMPAGSIKPQSSTGSSKFDLPPRKPLPDSDSAEEFADKDPDLMTDHEFSQIPLLSPRRYRRCAVMPVTHLCPQDHLPRPDNYDDDSSDSNPPSSLLRDSTIPSRPLPLPEKYGLIGNTDRRPPLFPSEDDLSCNETRKGKETLRDTSTHNRGFSQNLHHDLNNPYDNSGQATFKDVSSKATEQLAKHSAELSTELSEELSPEQFAELFPRLTRFKRENENKDHGSKEPKQRNRSTSRAHRLFTSLTQPFSHSSLGRPSKKGKEKEIIPLAIDSTANTGESKLRNLFSPSPLFSKTDNNVEMTRKNTRPDSPMPHLMEGPCLITTAMPSAYWTGRFAGIHDAHLNELLMPHNLDIITGPQAVHSMLPNTAYVSDPSQSAYSTRRIPLRNTSYSSSSEAGPSKCVVHSTPGDPIPQSPRVAFEPGYGGRNSHNPRPPTHNTPVTVFPPATPGSFTTTVPASRHPSVPTTVAGPAHPIWTYGDELEYHRSRVDEASLLNDDDYRCRRIFMHLESLCATDEARHSLWLWQQDFARQTYRPVLLPLGGTMEESSGRRRGLMRRLFSGIGDRRRSDSGNDRNERGDSTRSRA